MTLATFLAATAYVVAAAVVPNSEDVSELLAWDECVTLFSKAYPGGESDKLTQGQQYDIPICCCVVAASRL